MPTVSSLSLTRARIDLAQLRRNARILQALVSPARVMGVVKADAYGHGALPVVRVLQEEGVRFFAVATLAEALELRNAGVSNPVLVFTPPLPEHLSLFVEHELDLIVASPAIVDAVRSTARNKGPLRVHVKVDTGMGRIGVRPDEAARVVRSLERTDGVTLAGLCTHFATADVPGDAFARLQLERFEHIRREMGDTFEVIHCANSGAVFTLPESLEPAGRSLARIGIALYGLADPRDRAHRAGLRPLMRLTSRMTQIKEVAPGTTISYGQTWRADRPTRIATIGAGYADGYPRVLSNRGEVGVCGRRFPVAGTICMDAFMVDLGPPDGTESGIDVGDEVVLFGPGGPSAFEVAEWARTIPYEICCGVSKRVPRDYVDDIPKQTD